MLEYNSWEIISCDNKLAVFAMYHRDDRIAVIRYLDEFGYFSSGLVQVPIDEIKPLDAIQKQTVNGWMIIQEHNEIFDLNEKYFTGE